MQMKNLIVSISIIGIAAAVGWFISPFYNEWIYFLFPNLKIIPLDPNRILNHRIWMTLAIGGIPLFYFLCRTIGVTEYGFGPIKMAKYLFITALSVILIRLVFLRFFIFPV